MLWLILVPFYFSPFFPIGFRFGLSSMKSPCQCHCCDSATGIFSVSVRLWKWWMTPNEPAMFPLRFLFWAKWVCFSDFSWIGIATRFLPLALDLAAGLCWGFVFLNEVRVINLTTSENGLQEWFHLKMNSQTFMLADISKTVLGYTIFSWNSSNVYRAFL